MPVIYIIVTIAGSLLAGLGIASVFSDVARTLQFLPGPAAGTIILVLGVCLVVFGQVGMRMSRLKQLPKSEEISSAQIPTSLRPLEWFTLVISITLVGYGVAGLFPDSWALLKQPEPWWLHCLFAALGLANVWRSSKNLGMAKHGTSHRK